MRCCLPLHLPRQAQRCGLQKRTLSRVAARIRNPRMAALILEMGTFNQR